MANITVTLTDTQTKCLEYAAYSVQDWCDNAIHERARISQDEIISKLVSHCNANDVAIATGVDAQITQAYSLNVVGTAKSISDAASSP
jgi:hypothetical protein